MKISNMWHHKETQMDTQQIPVMDNYTGASQTMRQPGPVVPRPLTPPNGYRQPVAIAQAVPQPFSPPVPPVVPETAKFQMRLTALRAAKDYLMERSYGDNAERLAAEVDLAKFYLGE
jgi:hypothetical protein